MKAIIYSVGVMLFIYLCTAFLFADFDFRQWHGYTRGVTLTVALIFGFLTFVYQKDLENRK